MKARIILVLIIALSLGSWVNTPEYTPSKGKDSVSRMAPPPIVKKSSKKSIKLLFESVFYHFM